MVRGVFIVTPLLSRPFCEVVAAGCHIFIIDNYGRADRELSHKCNVGGFDLRRWYYWDTRRKRDKQKKESHIVLNAG